MKSLLHKKSGKASTNRDEYVSLELGNQMKKISNYTDEHLVDLYQVYLDEKDASDKYRLIFTINPVCSNVLFNAITEVVYKEGSESCEALGDTPFTNTGNCRNIISQEPITRIQAIRDTEYSNDKILGLEYLPGIDIFNNHLIRQSGFDCVQRRDGGSNGGLTTGEIYKISDDYDLVKKSEVTDVFNTIRDYQRTKKGTKITKEFPGLDSTYLQPTSGQPHIYEESEILSFEDTFMKNLREKDGWFGFYNPSTIEIPVAEDSEDKNIPIYINKLINNRNACDFIDMFPDRKRFTFVPQKNRHRGNRLEKNWEYCLTYPYSSTEYLLDKEGNPVMDGSKPVLNPLVAEETRSGLVVNGLTFSVVTEIVTDSDKRRVIIQSTGAIHNLHPNETVALYYKANQDGSYNANGDYYSIPSVTVKGVGDKNGEMQSYFFYVDSDDVANWFDSEGKLISGITGRFSKVVFGAECLYYFRVFRRLPNFKDISLDEERSYYIGKYNKEKYDFNSEINKLAFANNIYGDNIVQIVYLDDIDVNGLTDNLERPLSDIYLTVVKSNKGHDLWYPESGEPKYNDSGITIARAFGKVTSGIDLPPEERFSKDYNVHRIHNISEDSLENYHGEFTRAYENISPINWDGNGNVLKTLEDDITIEQEFFLGDLVEFSTTQYQESILEPVYHRFNTAQREYANSRYKNIVVDEIYMDDYEGSETAITKNQTNSIEGNFKCVEDFYNHGYEESETQENKKVLVSYPGNLFPEGYFYQPHYRIHLKDVSEKISQSSDTQMELTDDGVEVYNGGNCVRFTTKYDYDLIAKDSIVVQDPVNNIFYEAIVTSVTGITGETTAEATLTDAMRISETGVKFLVFKKTLGIPKYAVHYPDTGGKYIWRALIPHSKVKTDSEIYDKPFANGAHYRHVGINFFLRRQDPYGYYELNQKTWDSTGEVNKLTNFMHSGTFNEGIYYNDAIEFGLLDIC